MVSAVLQKRLQTMRRCFLLCCRTVRSYGEVNRDTKRHRSLHFKAHSVTQVYKMHPRALVVKTGLYWSYLMGFSLWCLIYSSDKFCKEKNRWDNRGGFVSRCVGVPILLILLFFLFWFYAFLATWKDARIQFLMTRILLFKQFDVVTG